MSGWFSKFSLLLSFFVLLFIYTRFGTGIPLNSTVSQKQEFFSVSGTGKVSVVPDTAIVDLGISSTQTTVKNAQNQANTVINSVSSSLKSLGIESKDIKTSNYSIYPQYDFSPTTNRNRINGYQVNANLTITVRNLDKLNEVIDTATSQGANTVGGIQLTVDESKNRELIKQARVQAVTEARTKAQSLAEAAGIKLGKVVNVSESAPSNPIQLYNAKFQDLAVGAGGGSTNIEPGTTDVTSTVTLYFETR